MVQESGSVRGDGTQCGDAMRATRASSIQNPKLGEWGRGLYHKEIIGQKVVDAKN